MRRQGPPHIGFKLTARGPGRSRKELNIYSGATGAGELASFSFFSNNEGRLPTLLVAQADGALQGLAA